MKKLMIIAMLMFSIPAMAQIKSASLTASGLTCSMCSKAIYKALLKVPTIQSVDVDIKSSGYSIHFKDDASVVLDDVKKAVEDAGFFVAVLAIVAHFDNAQIGKDAHVSLGGSNFHFVAENARTLNGDVALAVIDKNYLPAKEYKKYSKQTGMKCYATGTAADCCTKNGITGRIYHVTLSHT